MASFDFEDFVKHPRVEGISECALKKDDWIRLADNYVVSYKRSWKKASIRNAVIQKMVVLKVLDVSALSMCEEVTGETDLEIRRLELLMEKKNPIT